MAGSLSSCRLSIALECRTNSSDLMKCAVYIVFVIVWWRMGDHACLTEGIELMHVEVGEGARVILDSSSYACPLHAPS